MKTLLTIILLTLTTCVYSQVLEPSTRQELYDNVSHTEETRQVFFGTQYITVPCECGKKLDLYIDGKRQRISWRRLRHKLLNKKPAWAYIAPGLYFITKSN